jgi:hypothetical protein
MLTFYKDKINMYKSKVKTTLTCFPDIKGITEYEFAPPEETIAMLSNIMVWILSGSTFIGKYKILR